MNIVYYQYFEYLSLLVAIICYRGLKRFSIEWFIPLIFLSCLADTLGENYTNWGLDKLTLHHENYFIYNAYLLVSTPILLYLFGSMLGFNERQNRIFFLTSAFVVLLMVLNYFLGEGVFHFNTNSLLLCALLSIFLSAFVLLRLAMEENRVTPLFKEPFFWICAATLLFGIGELILGLQTYIVMNKIEINGISIYTLIMGLLNVFLYSAFSFSFILCQTSSRK